MLRVDRHRREARLLDDGRVELDSNTVERALNRKNALFAGSAKGDNRAMIATLIETPSSAASTPERATRAITQLANGHPTKPRRKVPARDQA